MIVQILTLYMSTNTNYCNYNYSESSSISMLWGPRQSSRKSVTQPQRLFQEAFLQIENSTDFITASLTYEEVRELRDEVAGILHEIHGKVEETTNQKVDMKQTIQNETFCLIKLFADLAANAAMAIITEISVPRLTLVTFGDVKHVCDKFWRAII